MDNSHFELFNPKDMVHSVFDDINKLKNQAYKIRQKFIDNIEAREKENKESSNLFFKRSNLNLFQRDKMLLNEMLLNFIFLLGRINGILI